MPSIPLRYPEELVDNYAIIVYNRESMPSLLKYYVDGEIRANIEEEEEEIEKVLDRLKGLEDISIDTSLKKYGLVALS